MISRSTFELEPVLKTLIENAARLCGAEWGVIYRVDGEFLHVAAFYQASSEYREFWRQVELTPGRGSSAGRAALERRTVHIPDVLADPEYEQTEAQQRGGFRALLSVPMLREGTLVGIFTMARNEPRSFTDKESHLITTFADQAVIAIENVRLFKELQTSNRELTESLAQQTATAEILRVISGAPTDLQPVFDAILDSVMRLFRPWSANVCQFDGELIHLAATRGGSSEARRSIRDRFPTRPTAGLTLGRCILDRAVIEIHDVETDAGLIGATREMARARGWRSALAVPMLRDDEPVGAIMVTRIESGRFESGSVELLQTFADQAVIAIENARLFNETKEALERQTATSEILRVISSSPTGVQPVFKTILESALQLCGGVRGAVFTTDGEQLYLGAGSSTSEEVTLRYPVPLSRGGLSGRAILDNVVVHVPDVEAPGAASENSVTVARLVGYRSALVAPMVREGRPIGAIFVARREPGPFTDDQVALLQTFADQAVIAIENVRLFTDLQEKNQALTQAHAQVTEALDQQTATSEILRVISSSPTDVQPVFDRVVRSAVQLCNSTYCIVFKLEGERLHIGAHHGASAAGLDELRRRYPAPLAAPYNSVRCVRERAVIHQVNADTDPALTEGQRRVARIEGFRSQMWVPMLRDDRCLGVICLTRPENEPFPDAQVALVRTFADQAVIAIENARLFNETKEALERQTATSEILRVISSSLTDVQPVLDIVAATAARLCDAFDAVIRLKHDNDLRVVAHHGPIPVIEVISVDRRGLVSRRAVLEKRPVHLPDVWAETEQLPEAREIARQLGYRTQLLVPLLREGTVIGTIGIRRPEVRPFTDQQVGLLQTFADQAVIAIENVRLFNELQARTQELTRSVGQLTALGEVGRAVSSTLDLETVLSTIVSRAIQLSGTDGGSVYEYDEATDEFSLRASRDLPNAYVEQVRDTRPRKGEGAVGRVAQTREPVQIVDIADASAYESRVRNLLLQMGLRALLAVPLIAEGHLVGALIVMRKRTGAFADEEVALLQTFATQSALAIQNARLFREIEEKSRQLEVASQHKSEFLANMSHELRTPLNAIIGFSEVLSEKMFGELNEKQEEYSKDIHASGQHLLSLINDILDLSKIEAGRMELELSDFHFPTALDSALTLVRERAGRRSIALHLSVDERLGQIQADERKVRQVVLNLLSNAIKFTPEGGRIEVGAASKDGSVEVSVSDTGVGIAPEDQEKVFEEFRQVGTADKKVEGTGLGLTLCRKFVELHGGKIWVKSQPGMGSTFTFTVPVRPDK